MTPTMVRLTPERTSVRPTMAGSALNRARQKPSLMTTDRGPPISSSGAVNVRPCAAGTPRTLKKRGDVRIASTRSGNDPVVSVTFSK